MADERKFGWVRDKRDERDLLFSARRVPLAPIAEESDLEAGFSPVEDQLNTSSCVGNAAAGMTEFLLIKEGIVFEDFSRLFIYVNARREEGMVGEDSGCMIRDAIKGLAKYGVCSEKTWPFDPSKVTEEPSAEAYAEAKKHLILEYRRLLSLEEVLSCLSEGFPVQFGCRVYESYMNEAAARSGIIPYPKIKSEREYGGHSTVIMGHNLTTEINKFRNSWGIHWGQKGYAYMPFQYVEDKSLSSDFWTIRKMAA